MICGLGSEVECGSTVIWCIDSPGPLQQVCTSIAMVVNSGFVRGTWGEVTINAINQKRTAYVGGDIRGGKLC